MNLTVLNQYDSKKGTHIAGAVKQVYDEGESLAPKTISRLAVVAEYYEKLSIGEVQNLLDPVVFESEIEENQVHRKHMGFWTILRNILSLAPLIFTWLGLFLASSAYQQYWAVANSKTASEPFLQLWQESFHNLKLFGFIPHVPTFAEIALGDVVLLVLLLLCILRIQSVERKAQRTFNSFSSKLQGVTDQLLGVVATDGASSMDRIIKTLDQAYQQGLNQMIQSVKTISAVDTEKIADALKLVVEDTLRASEDVAKEAQRVIADLNSQLSDLVLQFHNDLGTLSTDLVGYDEHVQKLTDASTRLSTASSTLASNVNDLTKGTQAYADVGKDIRLQLDTLNTTQQQLVTKVNDTQQDITTKIALFASSMDSAAKATEAAAKELGQFTKADLQKMTQSVSLVADRVADAVNNLVKVQSSLSQVDKYLQTSVSQANQHLQSSLTQTDRHLQNSLQNVDQHLQTLLAQMNKNLESTGKQLQAAASALASVKGVKKKRSIWPLKRP